MPLKSEEFTCGNCGKPVQTDWVENEGRNGLLRGPYALLGDVFFHEPCANVWIEGANEHLRGQD